MYKTLQIFLIILFPAIFYAQVVEKLMDMSSGSHNGLEVELPVNAKTAEKIWKSYVKPYGKTDWDRRNKEHVLFDVRISSITTNPLTIVARFNQFKDITKGSFWFKSGGSFVSASDEPEILRNAAKFLQEYSYEGERFSIREALKNEEKSLSSMDKDLSRLQKKNQNLHKDIEKKKKEILDKEKQIEENLAAQEEKKKEMETQKLKIQETTLNLTNVGKGSE